MTISYPSTWVQFDVDIPHAVKAMGDPTGGSVCVVHIQKDVAIIQETEQVRTDMLRQLLFEQGIGESYVPTFCRTLRTGEVEGVGNPVKLIEYAGFDGQVAVHEMLFVFFHAKRLIVLRAGCSGPSQDVADKRFQSALPGFVSMLRSITFPDTSDKAPTSTMTVVLVAVAALSAVALIYIYRRVTSSGRSRRSMARRGPRRNQM